MKKNAFTLVELLAVIVVLGIVITISVTSVSGISETIKDKMYEKKINFIEKAAVMYGESMKSDVITSSDSCALESNYNCKVIQVKNLVDNGYIDKDSDTCSVNYCVVNPSNKDEYLDSKYIYIYYKNNRIYAKLITGQILTVYKGDVNFDGEVNEEDTNLISAYLAENNELSDFQKKVGDVNGSGYVTGEDEVSIENGMALGNITLDTSITGYTDFPKEDSTLNDNNLYKLLP